MAELAEIKDMTWILGQFAMAEQPDLAELALMLRAMLKPVEMHNTDFQ
jgi:hypothetical protein